MTYVYLLIAIVAEVAGTMALKASQGFSKLGPSLIVLVGYGVSFYLFSLVLKAMPVGVAYAIWAGVGTALITLVGFAWFKEPVTLVKLLSICAIIIGVVGLRLSAPA